MPSVLAVGEGKAPSLYAFLILAMSDISEIDWLSNGTEVPVTQLSRWAATESCVISEATETFTTNKSLVESAMPNLRNDSAI